MRYAIVIEQTAVNYSAYVPDLPGCVATGNTIEEVEEHIREAIAFHLEGLRKDGSLVPPPSSHVEYVDIAPENPLKPKPLRGPAIESVRDPWIAEALRRRDEVRSGKVKTIPADEVIARLRNIASK